MSRTDLPAAGESSETDRALIRQRMEAFEKQLSDHITADKSDMAEIRRDAKYLKRVAYQARAIAGFIVLEIGAAFFLGRWILDHYIADAIRIATP
jgi:hypothetical protein